jgi:adenylosuccinate lyase
LEIFHGDGAKIVCLSYRYLPNNSLLDTNCGTVQDKLNELLCQKAGFPKCYGISTQTYTRKVDLRIANALSAFGATVQKIAGDIRHLAAQKELEEPFEKNQIVGSLLFCRSQSL